MYISTDNFVPLTPASSQGSSATILPSLSVASSKNYEEPERGRSLSRSSSSSWTSGSGAMLLSPRSSVYSATPTPAHPTSYNVQYSDFSPFGNERRGQNAEPRYYPYVYDPLRPLPPPPPSSLQTPQVFTDIRGTNPCGYRPAYLGVNGVQCSVPSTSSSGGAATVQDSKGYSGDIPDIFSSRLQTNEELSWPPMRPPVAVPKVTPSSSTASPFDWWGPVRQTSAPDTGLFGPRTPRDATEPELQSTAPPSPKSPPRPLSRVTERTERTEIASAQAVSPPVPHLHPYSQHIAPIGTHSSDSPRGKVRQDAPVVVKAPTRSISPEEYSPQPSPTTAQPAPIVLSPYRFTTASSTSHICSCCSTPSPIIISTQPTTQRHVHGTLRERSRSRSRSQGRSPPPVITAGPSVVIQAGPHTPPPMSPPIGSRLSIRSRSRSSPRSPVIISDREILNSPRSWYDYSRSRSPIARTRTPEIQNPIIITPQIPESFQAARLVRASRRSRSRSPQSHAPPIPRDIIQRHERSRSHSPAFCRRSRSRSSPPSPRVHRVAPRSRSPRRYSSPRRYGSPRRSRSPRRYGSPRRSRSPRSPRYYGDTHYGAQHARSHHSRTRSSSGSSGYMPRNDRMLHNGRSMAPDGVQTPRAVNNPPAPTMSGLTDFLRSNGITSATAPGQVPAPAPATRRTRRSYRSPSRTRVHRRHSPASTSTSSRSSEGPPVIVASSGMTPPPAPPGISFPMPSNPGLAPQYMPPTPPPTWSAPNQGLNWQTWPPPLLPSAPYHTSAAQMHPWTPYPNMRWGQEPQGYPGWSNSWGHPQHPRYWHADGNLAIRVQNTDYNLHRHVFARAANFPPMWDPFQEPHYLSETKVDFDRLLSVLYPADYSEHECQTTEEWTSVLMLAERWKIQDVRRLAIKQLDLCAGPVDKIALGHRYSIPDWLGPAYLALITRREPFTREEGAKLGVEAMVRVGTLTDDLCDNFQDYVDEKKFSELFARKLAM